MVRKKRTHSDLKFIRNRVLCGLKKKYCPFRRESSFTLLFWDFCFFYTKGSQVQTDTARTSTSSNRTSPRPRRSCAASSTPCWPPWTRRRIPTTPARSAGIFSQRDASQPRTNRPCPEALRVHDGHKLPYEEGGHHREAGHPLRHPPVARRYPFLHATRPRLAGRGALPQRRHPFGIPDARGSFKSMVSAKKTQLRFAFLFQFMLSFQRGNRSDAVEAQESVRQGVRLPRGLPWLPHREEAEAGIFPHERQRRSSSATCIHHCILRPRRPSQPTTDRRHSSVPCHIRRLPPQWIWLRLLRHSRAQGVGQENVRDVHHIEAIHRLQRLHSRARCC